MTTLAGGPAVDPLPGSEFPLGATPAAGGTNFAVASSVAEGVLLCLFDDKGAETQIPLREYDAGVWHGFVPGVGPGQVYGYRATGPYDPSRGHPVFRRRRFLAGAEASELGWYAPSGAAMTAAQWADTNARSLAIYLDGADDPDRAADGSPLVDDDFLVLVNSWWEPLDFTLPTTRAHQEWHPEVETFDPSTTMNAAALRAGDRLSAGPRSVLVLRGPRP